MTKQEVTELIEKEFATAEQARKIGNDGMVRVCARRAAGAAISVWLQSSPRQGWGMDAMSQLRALQLDDSIPLSVRDAAHHLTAKVTEQFTPAFPADPILDSRIIIDYFLRGAAV